METKKIYLCGGMTNVDYDNQYSWRKECEDILENIECNYNVIAINPCDYYSFENILDMCQNVR